MKRFLALFAASLLPCGAALEVKEGEGRIDVLENGVTLTSYHVSKVPYLYPLPSSSGANLARYWPIEKDVEGVEGEQLDHPHHQSLWLSHGAVNGFDFWAWTGGGDPAIKHTGTTGMEASGNKAAFTVQLDWIADEKIQLQESRRYTFERIDKHTLAIGIESTLTGNGADVLLGDTKEGTAAVRVDRTLRHKGPMAKGHIIDSEGRKDGDCWGKRAAWIAFHGPDEKGAPAVLAMFDHPASFRHPTWWHARDYGLLAANPFGIHDFESKTDATLGNHVIKKDASLGLRYLVLLHHGTLETAKLDERWTEFSK